MENQSLKNKNPHREPNIQNVVHFVLQVDNTLLWDKNAGLLYLNKYAMHNSPVEMCVRKCATSPTINTRKMPPLLTE